jgi:hypothetical protein
MKSSKFWIAVAAAGIAMVVLDYVIQGMIMEKMYYSKHLDLFNAMTNPMWYIVGDFVAVLVLAWVYDKVSSSFAAGWKGGAMYGLYAGILVNFPAWIFVHLSIKGFSYRFAWFSTIYGVAWAVIAGAIFVALYRKGTSTSAAS